MDYAIIAAGEGSRLVQEGIKIPKPLIRLHGMTLIDRLIRVFLKNEATSIHIIVNEEMTGVQTHLQTCALPVPLHLHIQSTPSSMHSFYELSCYLQNECFCLTTVDTVFKEDEFTRYIQAFRNNDSLDGMMAVTGFIDDEKPLYVKTDPNLMIEGFYDQNTDNCRFISGGIYCLKRSGIAVLHQAMNEGISRMRNYQRKLTEAGLKLQAFPFTKIIDVDHAEDINKAALFLLS
ncbi:MAG: NDP-sugar synthase [Tannerella sp.]|jgi:NDP-sugar pyrophosphorylase family protein|nr:NDP-sugar synthase [Tannerella sp.]